MNHRKDTIGEFEKDPNFENIIYKQTLDILTEDSPFDETFIYTGGGDGDRLREQAHLQNLQSKEATDTDFVFVKKIIFNTKVDLNKSREEQTSDTVRAIAEKLFLELDKKYKDRYIIEYTLKEEDEKEYAIYIKDTVLETSIKLVFYTSRIYTEASGWRFFVNTILLKEARNSEN